MVTKDESGTPGQSKIKVLTCCASAIPRNKQRNTGAGILGGGAKEASLKAEEEEENGLGVF
jgi:hypothetical protein